MKLRIVSCVLFSTCTASAFAQQVIRSVTGAAGDRLGSAAVSVFDQNADGYRDVVVGAPGANGGRGEVRCISGKHLANGTLPIVLWTTSVPTINAGAGFGSSVIQIANLTGDSTADFVVSAPDFVPAGAFDTRGAIFLVDGATHAVVTFIHGIPNTRFGHAIAAVGDQTGDFKPDIAVSAPDLSSNWSFVHIVPGAAFGFTTAIATLSHPSTSGGWQQYGSALASGFDYDGDGKFDLAISSPDYGFNNPGAGWVEVRKANTLDLLGGYCPGNTDERFGSSIDANEDYDGDGVIDLVVGGPGWNGGFVEDGRVVILSGAKFCDPQLPGPLELHSIGIGFSSTLFDLNFGAAVRACGDLNQDGVNDVLAGAPSYATLSGGNFQNKGAVAVISGATGTRMGLVVGASADRLGDALGGEVDDFDSDGFVDFVIAGTLSDAGGVDGGVLKACRLFPATPVTYCTGKVNSLGCTPAMSSTGSASASNASPFLVTCANVVNQKSGLLFYSHAPNAAAFQGGTLCVRAPLKRTGSLSSGGSASGSDCTGAFSFDMNARIQSGVDSGLVAGAHVFGQYWSRDPASPSTTSLSNALRFLIGP